MKYKQKEIPRVAVPKYWYDLSVDELKSIVKQTYKQRWQGKAAFNQSTKLHINFSGQGKNKASSRVALTVIPMRRRFMKKGYFPHSVQK